MTGSGNDFVFLDGRVTEVAQWPPERIAAVCHRRNGVGADGLVILTPAGPASEADQASPGLVTMDFYNSDGSRAAMCGNAALCATRLSRHLGLVPPGAELMELATDAGRFLTRTTGPGWVAEINLPPFDAPEAVESIALEPGERVMAFAVVGVPHLVVVVDDIEGIDLEGRGRELRNHPDLASRGGANVNFVARPASSDLPWPVRTYERGVEGETLACGTGTVACGAVLAQEGLYRLPGRFLSRGGSLLSVAGSRSGQLWEDVWLCGEGRLVFSGRLTPEA